MLNIAKIGLNSFEPFPSWPPVHAFSQDDLNLLSPLLNAKSSDIREHFAFLRNNDYQRYAETTFHSLGILYAHFYGYADAPHISTIEDVEAHYVRVKRILEDEMVRHIFKPDLSEINLYIDSTQATVTYLKALTKHNTGIYHEFFDYIEKHFTLNDMKMFLWLETMRNEVVDDEVAMMVPGTQNAMKQVLSSNLWDECGNGKIDGFHTSWLIRLLSSGNQWQDFSEYRRVRPWFSMATSHSFNTFLTTPGRNFAAYGTFLINESWVIPHFVKILSAMNRLGIDDPEIRIYFEAHCNIDDHHTAELIEGIAQQTPVLTQSQLREVLIGAHQAIASATVMYSNLLTYFKKTAKESNLYETDSIAV